MKKSTTKILNLSILILLISQFAYSQLSNFTFSVSSTNETCLGNGSLTFAVSNVVVGASIDYSIYVLPNTTTPIAVITSSTYTGLNAGNYLVVATQSFNGNSSVKQQNITILNAISTITFSLSSTKVKCINDGTISVNVLTGNPVTYQLTTLADVVIISQPNPVFTGLSAGTYKVKVIDSCNEIVVQTFTLLQQPIFLNIDLVTFPNTILPTCNTIVVSNYMGVTSGFEVAYPLSIQYTIYPPTGAPITQNATLSSGNLALQTIPFYNNQSYYYNLKVTDACGTIYTKNNNVVNKKLEVTVETLKLNCTDLSIKIVPSFYVGPYSITFLTFPLNFNPVTFNSNHPGPFSGIFTLYGSIGNSFPVGDYSLQLNDSCGRSVIKNFTVISPNAPLSVSGSNNGCGQVVISIQGNTLVSVIITNAPAAFQFPLPYNASQFINPSGSIFTILGLPEGTYTMVVTDSCGNVTTVFPSVLPYLPPVLGILQRPGCQLGYGSIKVTGAGGISSVVLTAAPVTYLQTLPVNLSSNIVANAFYLGSVPQGNYTFTIVNNCGASRIAIVNVIGYQVASNTITITENCNSFNLNLQYVSNGNFQETYWLQKFNVLNNTWGNPNNGTIYIDGTIPNGLNSVNVTNNFNTINLGYTGQFRIFKRFPTFTNNGNLIECFEIIKNFSSFGVPQIISVNAFVCANNSNEIIIDATGIAPLTYSITTKNNVPFLLDNGDNNIFTNLESAIYNFEVKDVCGNVVNSVLDISTLAPITIQATPFCNGNSGSLSVTPFSYLNFEWYKGTNTTTILSTTNNLNFTPFNAANNSGIYYVKITNPNQPTSCSNIILNYTIVPVTSNPNAGLDTTITYCGSQGIINLTTLLMGNFDANGTWQETTSSGQLINNLWNSTNVNSGTYTFKYVVDGLCFASDFSIISITINPIPQAPIASVDAIICQNQTLNLYATSIANGSYSWSGPNGFTSTQQNPTIANVSTLNNGVYEVKSILNNCQSISSTVIVAVNNLPQFSLDGICNENIFSITATPIANSFNSNAVSYSWTGPNNFSSTSNPINITGKPRGNYSLTIQDSFGCTATQTIEVLKTLCTIPKGVSVNNDGTNDTFNLQGFDIKNVKIFNRYGMKIYEKANYLNEWNGQDFNGNLLPSATYYYQIELTTGEIETGWVYLQRD